ncbi:hypothetical protein LCGC14_1662520 [marine sediment metagenome]|uniref:Uncharacterized protein n=1 Tax=marine sediment metagenome TaxID=412755 RepID=A0A0F9HTN7_9ZZZZ
MKIRKGFVSNSSSSSFVVATSGSTNGKITLTIEVDLKDYADKSVKSEKELLAHLKQSYAWTLEDNYDDSIREWYEKASKAIKNGKTVYFGSFGDEGTSGAETMLCDEGLQEFVSEDDNIEIIHSEGGY